MTTTFLRLVRFADAKGQIHYGEAGEDWKSELKGREVRVFKGTNPWDADFKLSENKAIISEVLCPLERVPNVLAIGLNYRAHFEEAGVSNFLAPYLRFSFSDDCYRVSRYSFPCPWSQ